MCESERAFVARLGINQWLPHPQTIKSKNSDVSLCDAHVLFHDLHSVIPAEIGRQGLAVAVDIPLEMLANLIIPILLDSFSLTITGCDFQGRPSSLSLPSPPPPPGLVMFDPGPGEAGQTFSPDSGALPSVYHAL